jgi:hypothetical protein
MICHRLPQRRCATACLRRRSSANSTSHLPDPSALRPQCGLGESDLAGVGRGAQHARRYLGTTAACEDDEVVLRNERLRHQHSDQE